MGNERQDMEIGRVSISFDFSYTFIFKTNGLARRISLSLSVNLILDLFALMPKLETVITLFSKF